MSSYHGWTHRPKALGGTDPIPVSSVPFVVDIEMLIQVGDPPQAISDDTPTILTFDRDGFWSSNDEWASAGNESLVHNISTTSTQSLFMYRPGIYWAAASVVWESGNYPKQTRLLHHRAAGIEYPGPLDFPTSDGWSGTFHPPPLANGLLAQNPVNTGLETAHYQGHLFYVASLAGVPDEQFQVQVHHTAGGDRDVTGANLVVIRLAHVDGENASA